MKGGGLGAILLPLLLLLSGHGTADYGIKTNKLTFLSQSEHCKKEISLYEEGNSFFIRNKENTYLEVQEKVTAAGSLNVFGTVHTNEYRAFEQSQWALHHLDTFDRKGSAWTPSDISTCGNSPDTFLGGPCIFGALEANTTVRDIPKHSALKIKLRVHFFDAWEGDSLFLQADRKTVWAESYKSNPVEKGPGEGINLCGKETPDRLSVPVDVEFEHSSDTVSILIGSTLKKTNDACTTSWGVDDLHVYYK
ncbi:conserved Plasmodium protein, unknown function [Plasmodium vivax]|uniref:(malaria parasite P. vivax) hypothetical protein n=1 Tax=Plasmodium vivax TaxID=5855 RepID=A0A1G4GXJ8_PLAVI|nr:unnamed protein product [Plasmodium vivax]CAI7720472.1 conserved protein, unknown function [Plasmodium vivax]SCO67288.1 conserved Plasmodium protein, unknown function [Plasmodium vivax]SCO72675.1 conserved Plasmodium protein, unknown function [Plasmodium vivax]VUZ95855.1 conserved protein, unknown function [Plasmodium vivax]